MVGVCLIVIILIDVLSLSSLCTCDCVTGLVSNHLKVLKWQTAVQAPTRATASSSRYWGPGSETLNLRVRRICCLNNLETACHRSRKQLWNENGIPFLWEHKSPKRKAGNESQFLGSLIRSPGSPRRRERSGVFKEEKRTNTFFFLYIP